LIEGFKMRSTSSLKERTSGAAREWGRADAAASFAVLLLIAGCAGAQKPAENKGEVAVEVERVLPKAESLDASAVEVTLKIVNPTDAPIKIDRIDFQVDTKDVAGVLKGSAPSSATIESQQAAELTFAQSIKFPEDKDAYQAVLGRGTIPVDMTGSVVLADGTKLKFESHRSVATPSLPQFVVFDAQAARYEQEGLDVTLFLRMINENVFPVTIETVKYTVYIEDKKIKSEQAIAVKLLQGGAEEYEVTTILDSKMFPEKGKVKSILASGKVGYKVTGKIALTRLDIPFEITNEIALAGGE
jgi:LEA14-like dessication related protein